MSRHKLVIYSPGFPSCLRLQNNFNTEFETEFTYTEEQLQFTIEHDNPEGIIACFCTAGKEDMAGLLSLSTFRGQIPLFTCSKNLTLDFVNIAVQLGVNRFLCCKWGKEEIEDNIFHAIRCNSIKDFMLTLYPGIFDHSHYILKIIEEIVHAFPRRMNENQMAERLGISMSWLQKLCRKAFRLSFHRLLRRIWIGQALCMMRYTNLDNTEIALFLNYSDESGMARDFRKETGLNPSNARKSLRTCAPEELLRQLPAFMDQLEPSKQNS